MEISGPTGGSGSSHRPDYAEMRRSMLESARGGGLAGLGCPTPDCNGRLQVADGEVVCGACGGPDDGRPAGLIL